MINRKILYGYRIRNGEIEAVPEEERVVRRIFTFYQAGASYQNISDALNSDHIPYCCEAPLWNKHKIKRVLENERYTGTGGYPEIVESATFRAVNDKIAEKNEKRKIHGEKPVIDRIIPYLYCDCGEKLSRLGGSWQSSEKLHLKCRACNRTMNMDMDATLREVTRQLRERECAENRTYVPSAEVIRLQNAINRGLEQLDSPESVIALILQGAAARYACCPAPEGTEKITRSEIDWGRLRHTVSSITLTADHSVTIQFKDDEITGGNNNHG